MNTASFKAYDIRGQKVARMQAAGRNPGYRAKAAIPSRIPLRCIRATRLTWGIDRWVEWYRGYHGLQA